MGKKFLWLFVSLISLKLAAQENQIDSLAAHWSYSAWAEMFIIPGEKDYFNPTFYARTTTLHLEGRYNYEDRNTASLWAGRRFQFGEPVKFVMVPMAAIVFGNTNGVAPGLEMEIMYRKIDFYTENEYVFDIHSQDNNFFYMYSELAIRPIKAIRTGLIGQRTKLVQTEQEVQKGIFAEYFRGPVRVGAFCFGPFTSGNYWIASISFDF